MRGDGSLAYRDLFFLKKTEYFDILLVITYFLTSIPFEVRIEAQRPSVHYRRIMRSYDYGGKGNLPKQKDSHGS